MKCFVCRNIGKEQCKACDNQSNFAPKTITDLVAEGVEIFNLKMERPQYAEYKTNKKLRLEYIGFEIDPKTCEMAKERIQREFAQASLFWE